MQHWIIDAITVMLSTIALVLSFMNYLHEKRKVISDAISKDRMKWIADVRSLISDFLESYIREEDAKNRKIIKAQIDLYIKYNNDFYDAFEQKLSECILKPYSEDDYRDLVEKAQEVLSDVWKRVKNETGVTQKDDEKISKQLMSQK